MTTRFVPLGRVVDRVLETGRLNVCQQQHHQRIRLGRPLCSKVSEIPRAGARAPEDGVRGCRRGALQQVGGPELVGRADRRPRRGRRTRPTGRILAGSGSRSDTFGRESRPTRQASRSAPSRGVQAPAKGSQTGRPQPHSATNGTPRCPGDSVSGGVKTPTARPATLEPFRLAGSTLHGLKKASCLRPARRAHF